MTAFVIAMDSEAECVVSNLTDSRESCLFGRRVVRGRLGSRDVAVVVSGVGKDNAAAATQLALSEFHPDGIANVGLAGALYGNFRVGQICPVRNAVEYDFDLAQLNDTEVGVLNERKDPYVPFWLPPGVEGFTLGTGDRFTDNETDIVWLMSRGVSLRDMEGAAIAHVCETAGVKCRAWKCISDVHGDQSMIGQYKANAARALEVLRAAVPTFLE